MVDISRRGFFASSAAAGAAGALGLGGMAEAAGPAAPIATKNVPGLPDVWGPDFLYQWSPPENLKRDLTPGGALIRLSGQINPRLTSAPGQDWNTLFKTHRDAGYTAIEAASDTWVNRKFPDSEVREIKAAQQANDVIFYNIHCAGNIIAPDPDADRWQRHIIDTIHAAEEFGVPMILTHVGSMYPNRNIAHPQNWSREAWQRSVNALKRICKDTAGSKVEIAIEPVNTESINNPWAQKRLREDVGDPRIMSGLDITNMVAPNVAFRMTEMIDLTFDLLEDQIRYVHAKDFVWNGMLAGLDWALQGTGNMDYELFMARVSRLKHKEVFMLVEFLTSNEDYVMAQRNVRAIGKKVGVKIHGTQGGAA
ncbi:sugar phosphate isomerase/epimerase family protein [Sphingomonas quercus]|uniref:Sugar phosphate isomerase/epimerase n=1 Tax=Sphingomonas quercus TaxID=2842451 RepID=A0ABS6BNT9_9SPHN|nr:sugar phosphate isomerase/epimerase family protein [Sphingomonas quercus]MBU3079056.1 sugar phosphate isomerase/epimerase [Sphingomonas quercus]